MSVSTEAMVATTSGKIEGTYKNGLYIFRGVPYAAPPVGRRRWLPPEPAEPWRGVRPAQRFATIAPQNPIEIQILAPPEPEPQDEDCLYLNIWTPGLDDARRPVMVWIHGGGFTMGSGSSLVYNGRTLSTRGNAVIVTINYRLGSLGFLNLNEVTGGQIPATGNEGLLDQIAALKWVRDNIALFGGDPDNVTIFGESAGGMSVGTLLAMPAARGLFHRAICQSGAASSVHTLERATRVAKMFLETAGASPKDVAGLRALTVDKLLPAQTALPQKTFRSDLRITLPFQPVVEGKTLPSMPLRAIEGGSTKAVPVMVGTTLEEWKLFALADPDVATLDEAGLVRRLARLLPAEYVPGLVEAYRSVRARRGEPTSPGELFTAIETDRIFRLPAVRLMEAQRKPNPEVFSYIFTWKSPALGGQLGACHAIDIGFVFGTFEANFSGSGPEANALARNIQNAWLAFARTGSPSTKSLGEWPQYGANRETMFLGAECQVVKDPFAEERRAWEKIPREHLGML
jgi:para-nitrobenzyl esterase